MLTHQSAWGQICTLYSLPGVSPHCLALQDKAGVSVTALLTLMVHAASGEGAVPASLAVRVADVSEAFQASVLRHLRQVRTGLKRWTDGPVSATAQALRQTMLERELEAERLEQQLVLSVLAEHGSCDRPEDPLADCARTVARYLTALRAPITAELYQSLVQILSVVLEDYDGLHVARVLDAACRECV